jgi:hypothetical protein
MSEPLLDAPGKIRQLPNVNSAAINSATCIQNHLFFLALNSATYFAGFLLKAALQPEQQI